MLLGWRFRLAFFIVATVASPAFSQVLERASVGPRGREADGASGFDALSISRDGRFVAFRSGAANLVDGDRNGVQDVFVRDRATGETIRASVDSMGREADAASGTNGVCLSADGRFVAFTSAATNLAAGDAGSVTDAYVHDLLTGATTRVDGGALGAAANGPCESVSLSATGRWAVFASSATNVLGIDANGSRLDVFVRDEETGETSIASVSSTGDQGNADSRTATISADGRWVVFVSAATNLVADDQNGFWDVFVHDRDSGETTRASVATDGTESNGHSYFAMASSDARWIVFTSLATNLVGDDRNEVADVFVRDRLAGETVRVSVDSDGFEANGASGYPTISGDGRVTAYRSDATNLVDGDLNERSDVFVHDRDSGLTTRASLTEGGEESNGNSGLQSPAAISPDGHHVAFGSDASNLVPEDTNGWSDVFVAEHFTVRLAEVVPAVGSEAGGELVHVYGSELTSASDTTMWFGRALATVVGSTADHVDVRTPAGSGIADVAIANRNGAFTLPAAFRYERADVVARWGDVNVGRGDREDVLLVNALTGDERNREISLETLRRIVVVMTTPSSRPRARFALWAWIAEPDPSTLAALPQGIGSMVFAPPFAEASRPPNAVWNNLGRSRRLGAATRSSRPAPSIVFDRATGARNPATVALQGIVEDDAAANPLGISVTNAIVLRIH
jgi:Tol biopolymer transport system component